MDIGICVEGQNDQEAIKSLLSKINSLYGIHNANYVLRWYRGFSDLIKNLHQALFEFNQSNIQVIVVIIDNDREVRHQRLKKLIEKCKATCCNFDYIAPAVAVEALEAWLLSDESALSRVTRKTIACQPNPEAMQKPDLILREITQWHSSGIPYHEVLDSIAKELDLELVKKRCRSFNHFYSLYTIRLRNFTS